MLKKIFLFSIFLFLIASFSACTLIEPGLEKNISTQNDDSEINIGNPQNIQLDEENNDNSLRTEQNSNLIIPKENMNNTNQNENNIAATKATINTNKGNIVIKLEPTAAPNTVKNFEGKALRGFYNGLTFHRVEDWVIQGGDPQGNGTGGGKMPTEINELPFTTGSVGIARSGDIAWSNDSQFFICTTDCSWLNEQYTNFGQVIEGIEIAKQIEIGDTIQSIIIE